MIQARHYCDQGAGGFDAAPQNLVLAPGGPPSDGEIRTAEIHEPIEPFERRPLFDITRHRIPFDLAQAFHGPPHQTDNGMPLGFQAPDQRAADETRRSGHRELHIRSMTVPRVIPSREGLQPALRCSLAGMAVTFNWWLFLWAVNE